MAAERSGAPVAAAAAAAPREPSAGSGSEGSDTSSIHASEVDLDAPGYDLYGLGVEALRQPSGQRASAFFSALTWNVLADAYFRAEQFPLTPPAVRDPRSRQAWLASVVARARADVLLLQEVDQFNKGLRKRLETLGYVANFHKRLGKPDGCVIAWRRAVFKACGPASTVNFDDIADDEADELERRRLLRRNVAALQALRHTEGGREVLVCSAHLFWNPAHTDVKFRQAQLLLNSVPAYLRANGLSPATPVLLCGDFNSTPDDPVYELLAFGRARVTFRDKLLADRDGGAQLGRPAVVMKGPQVLLLVDSDLVRLARLLRSIGVDVAEAASDDVKAFFAQARAERRFIVTRRFKLLDRNACPPAYVVRARTLRESFKEVVRRFDLSFDKKRFYSRCTLCNGDVELVTVDALACLESAPEWLREAARKCLAAGGAGPIVDRSGFELREFFRCRGGRCAQLYWWSAKSQRAEEFFLDLFAEVEVDRRFGPNPSDANPAAQPAAAAAAAAVGAVAAVADEDAAAEAAADALAEEKVPVAKRPREASKEGKADGDGKAEASAKEEKDGDEDGGDGDDGDGDGEGRAEEEEEEANGDMVPIEGSHELGLRSLFHDGEPEATNIRESFCGTLDYMFFSQRGLAVANRTRLPVPAHVLDAWGGPLPNFKWPSDHLALMATFAFTH